MGKSGQLLRAKKRQSAMVNCGKDENGRIILIPQSWLSAHDKKIEAEYRKRWEANFNQRVADINKINAGKQKAYEEGVWAEVNAEWKRRNERFNSETGIAEILSLTLSIPIKVLIETFGWNPDIGRKNGQLHRFHNAMLEEINKILSDENVSIEHVARYIADQYGISWSKQILEEDENETNERNSID